MNGLDYERMAKRKTGWGGRREGAGRPTFFHEPVDRRVRLERSEAEAAENFASDRGISLSELIRRALRSYLNRQKRR